MISLSTLGLLIGFLSGISGLSYSKVFVQSGSDIIPLELSYGAPGVVAGPQIGQLSYESVVPVAQVPGFAPCGTPCVISQPAENARLVTYNSPVVPVVVAAKEEIPKYEYSYVVIDENTGDQKSQQEFSADGVVQGQYSLLQPDGYVREVKYTADDLRGFNAVVRSFLPEDASNAIDNKNVVPCDDAVKENLQEAPKTEEATTVNADVVEVITTEPQVTTDTIKDLQVTTNAVKDLQATTDTLIETSSTTVIAETTTLQATTEVPVLNPFGIDLTKCLQNAINKQLANTNPPSMLTYILIPTKFC